MRSRDRMFSPAGATSPRLENAREPRRTELRRWELATDKDASGWPISPIVGALSPTADIDHREAAMRPMKPKTAPLTLPDSSWARIDRQDVQCRRVVPRASHLHSTIPGIVSR